MKQHLKLSTIALLLLSPLLVCVQVKLKKELYFNNTVELSVPEDFTKLSEAEIAVKYPNKKNKQALILSNKTGEINIMTELLNEAYSGEETEEYMKFQVSSIKEAVPTAEWKGDGIKTINGKQVIYLKFIVKASDSKIFNYFFFTNLGDKTVMVTFNCTERFLPEWEQIADEIANSLKIL
jgi:hypothetical protein